MMLRWQIQRSENDGSGTRMPSQVSIRCRPYAGSFAIRMHVLLRSRGAQKNDVRLLWSRAIGVVRPQLRSCAADKFPTANAAPQGLVVRISAWCATRRVGPAKPCGRLPLSTHVLVNDLNHSALCVDLGAAPPTYHIGEASMNTRYVVIAALAVSFASVGVAHAIPGTCWPKPCPSNPGGTGMNHGIGAALKGLGYKIRRKIETKSPAPEIQKKVTQ
jgi:hypothetical protein